jgi:peptidylprolyl isomerase
MSQGRITGRILRLIAALFLSGAALADTPSPQPMTTTTDSGLQYSDQKIGTGEFPQAGQTCVVRYTVWLWKDGKKGKKIDSSFGRGPFEFALGQGNVIPGWDEGVATMKPGGKRTLIVPPALAYGEEGAGGGVVPPNASLIFDIELVKVM